ncbi:amino acid permease [Maricurvus nonylphenolicus]|uniref:APC family permease n=1 Tax=Maricurvus nonylphenolicus TaxID=1008307 RepID=UPI0036F1BBAF
MNQHENQPALKRSLSLWSISFYGIGTIVGAGIYVLIGKVGLEAGIYMPLSFLLAGVIAAFTALSYAEMSSRFPRSAGSAIFVFEAWHSAKASQITAIMVALSGIISAAAISNGFVGYLNLFIPLPPFTAITLLALILAVIAAWGIKESAVVITLITLIEVGGLLFVIYCGLTSDYDISRPLNFEGFSSSNLLSIGVGSFLAFYAFIGFEDMVNVAEEVKDPRRNLPRAIIIAIVVSSILYISVALIAVISLPIEQLANSDAPLATIVKSAGYSTAFIGLISLFAVVNGALVQLIMASRLLYGMASQGLFPSFLAHVNAKTQTPIIATTIIALLIWVFATLLPITLLAKTTSFIMLSVFAVVNLALIMVKRQQRDLAVDCKTYSVSIPIIGLFLCLLLLALQTISLDIF